MQHCYNRGCGQTFDPEKNSDESCRHHPGAPYFHDAYKGWSCCNKKSVDFTEFLSIKGCTLSKHSNIKPPEPEKPERNDDDKNEVIEVRSPIKESMDRPPIETPMIVVQPTVAQALKDAIDTLKVKVGVANEATTDSGAIPIGTSCKNKGCTCSFTGTAADHGECVYHPGVPIFHEGMKYWSCCQRKTSDFAAFIAQKGCASGEHKWFKEDDDKQVVNCRYDWHQTPTHVIVSIYAKKYHYRLSKVEVNPIRLHVNLVFPEQEDAQFDLELELRGIIDVSKTTAHMYGTKLEITMPKAEPGSWSKLDFPREKLPPVLKPNENKINASNQRKSSESDDGFNLDDIETVNTGIRLTDISDNKNHLD
ncbi:cysteine and histidine-rich domain-containing protein [Rhagoletis pomonella]|uniref:cysteine and histidine-rich domain-containing protein n=1 Tax=Rhagoletis pomonella TaxID=28610 RepID=UPI00178747A8|nr:cysteine and histidine-rich domain-containing protein [Rhagoletis pomonella]